MKKTNWITLKLTSDATIELKEVTSFTLHNVGNCNVIFRERIIEPEQSFVLEGDGSYSDIDFKIEFQRTAFLNEPAAILDYRSLLKCQ